MLTAQERLDRRERRRACLRQGRKCTGCVAYRRYRLGAQRIHDQGVAVSVTEALSKRRVESGAHCGNIAQRNLKVAVGPLVAHKCGDRNRDAVGSDALGHQRVARVRTQPCGLAPNIAQAVICQRHCHRPLAHRPAVCQAHAVSRQHASKRVDDYRLDTQRLGDQASMLSARTAKTRQRKARYVMTARYRDCLDRIRHIGDRNRNQPLRCRLGRQACFGGNFGQSRSRSFGVEWRVSGVAENLREKTWDNLAERDVAIGDSQRTFSSVARRPRHRASGLGADPQPPAIKTTDRAAAGCDRVDAQHRRTDAYPCDNRLVVALITSRVERHIGRCAAHVEADDAVEPGAGCGLGHADDTPRRTRKDRVLAAKGPAQRQPAVRLHEQRCLVSAECCLQTLDITPEHRREISIDHAGIAASDKLDERSDLVADRNLRKADVTRNGRQGRLMRWMTIAVHQHDRDRSQPLCVRIAKG